MLLGSCALPEQSGPFVRTPLSSPPAQSIPAPGGKCRLSDLSASLSWNAGGRMITGAVQLANFGEQPCTLQGVPQISLYNQNDWQLPVEFSTAAGEAPALLLDPAADSITEAAFAWSNWCTAATLDALVLEVTLPGHPGALRLLVQDPNGRPIGGSPECEDVSAPSRLVVDSFQ